ncbi:ABC transporter ATP-binding protein [Paenibacillus sp. GSMTC-2017]|uniref:ABC transporter ATP-binding protein n=1 Tax=Paenibacillus sp. GSMTC-2017 TaxID=2794350 RepID=UPI0018D67681|nr:ABC transporter ATP-binding protein [Paenibacillus sp. GSMTC-2017]MBH5319286.1 ABC transporter ATP-binding protein [Paenibacillus sp. GSMTC-2017]
MRTVFSYLKRYRIAAATAILLMLIELTLELLQPFIIAKIIDNGILQNQINVVLLWGGVLVACSIVVFGIGILSSFYAAHVSQSFGFDLREKLFEKVQTFSYTSFIRFPEASLITRLTNDVMQLQNTVFMGLRIMLRAPLYVIGSIVMAFIVNPALAIWFALTIPFLALFLGWALKRGEVLFRDIQKQLDQVNGIMQQNLIGMRLIRVFVRIQHETGRFGTASGELMNRAMTAMKLTELTMPVVLLVLNVSIIAVLWFGRIHLDAGVATVGEIVAIVNYMTRTAGALSLMSMLVVSFSKAKASAQRIEEVILIEDDLKDITEDDENINQETGKVEFCNVSFRYPNTDNVILENISFQAAPAQTIAIMGSTGSGKSTLLQLIPRFYDVDEGTLLIDDIDNRLMKLERLRQGIGYVPQEVLLFTGTVAENIRWGKDEASLEEIMDAARLAQIHETIMKLPLQYDSIIGQKGINLSGGQKQRLTIARALVRKPSILLLDDCTSALDVHTESALLESLKEMQCTTFLVTQKISSTVNADNILLIDDGKLLASGTHQQLMNSCPLYMKIYKSQHGRVGVSYV